MLETIRAFCLERLAEAGEEDRARRLMSGTVLALVEHADPLLRTAEQRRRRAIAQARSCPKPTQSHWPAGRASQAS